MNLRKFTSLSLVPSGLTVAVTGIALFFDVTAEIVETSHEVFSIAFLAALFMHALLNIKSLKKCFVFKTPEFRWNVILFAVLLLFSVIGAIVDNEEDDDNTGRTNSEHVIEIES